MIFITFLATLILSGHAGADDLSELRIGPETDVVRKIGDTFTLYCKTIEGITDVQWIGPDMEVIPLGSSPRRSVEKSGQDLLLDIRDLTREDDGVYRCKGLSTSTNKTIEASKQVSVYDPAEFVNPSEIQDFVIGETILVKCNATGNPVPTISWFREGQKIDTELNEKYFEEDGSTNLGIRNISKDEEGMYRCKARQLSKGLSKDLDIQVNVNIPPKIENFTTEYTATAEETETFFCEATGDPEPQYSWYMGDGSGGDTFLTSESALKLFVTWDMNDRAYTCVAINAGGRDMATFTLTVQVKPNFTVERGDSTREREAALLKCVADGVPTPVVHFYRDDLLIPATALPETVDESDDASENDSLSLGSWSPNRMVYYDRNEATIEFIDTDYKDAGKYECRAENDAGLEITNVNLEVFYSPRAKSIISDWACEKGEEGRIGELQCEFTAYPPPNLTWGQYLPADGANENDTSNYVAFNVSNPPTGVMIEETGGILNMIIDTELAKDPFRTYVCTAENSVGSIEETAQLKKARRPDAPYGLQVYGVTTNEATVSFIPVEDPLVPDSFFTIKFVPASVNGTDRTVNVHPTVTEHTVRGLSHNTKYTVLVEAENCAGTSDGSEISSFTTKAIENPEPVEIISGKISEDHDKYTVQWMPGSVGGGEISKISITLYKIEELLSGQNVTEVGNYEIPPENLDSKNGSYVIEDLNPLTSYEILVEIYNEVGSAEARKQFQTNMKPEVTTDPSQNTFSRASVDIKLIIIIIAVLILIIIIVDITCCATRSWGLTFCIYTHTCGKGKKHNIEDAEEGSAESRGLTKLDPIDEQTPLQTDEAAAAAATPQPVASGNGTAEGAKEQEAPAEKVEENVKEEMESEQL